MAQIKLAEYTFDNSVGDVTLTLTPNTITMTKEDSVSGTTTRRIVYIDDATMPTQITFSVREPLLTVDYLNIDSNITSMRQLFHNATNLTYINVDNWNTSNVTDLYQCFGWTTALTQNIDFTKMDFTKVTSWHHAFAYSCFPRIDLSHISPTISGATNKEFFGYCKAEYINISGWTFTNTMSQLFNNATQLKTVVLDNVVTTGVTDMGTMFRNCYNLKTIDVSSFDTSSVTSFTDMFNNCKTVTEIKGIENFDVSKVTSFGSMFINCSSLTKLDLRNWVTSSATEMGSMFNGCANLEILRVDNFDTSSVGNSSGTGMSSVFTGCKKLKTLNLNSFTRGTNLIRITGFLQNCESLEYFSMQNFDFSGITTFQSCLQGCKSLKMLDLTMWDTSSSSTTTFTYCFNGVTCPIYYNSNICTNTTITGLSNAVDVQGRLMAIYDFNNTVTTSDSAYPTLTGSTVVKTVDTQGSESYITHRVIGVDVMPTAISFQPVTGLLNVDYLAVTSSCTSLQSLFDNCIRLENINTFGWDTQNVTTLYACFQNCGLTNVDLQYFNTSKVTDMGYLFKGSAIQQLDMSSFDTSSCTSFNRLCSGCTSLTTVKFGNLNTTQVKSMTRIFEGCTSLTGEIDMTSFNTKAVTDGSFIFSNVPNNQNIVVYVHDTNWTISESSTDYNGTFVRRLSTLLAKYTFDNSIGDCLPTFTSITTSDYMTSDIVNDTVTTRLLSTDSGNTITKISFGSLGSTLSLLTLDYLKIDKNITQMNDMFQVCSNVTTINTQDWDTSNVTNMGYLFQSCGSLTEVIGLETWDTSKVEYMNQMFTNSKVPNVSAILNWDVSNCKSFAYMFSNANILDTELNLSNWQPNNLENCQNMFANTTFTSINLSGWNVPKLSNMSSMFAGIGAASKLLSVNMNNWTMETPANMNSMFYNNANLTSIDFTGSKMVTSNLSQAFQSCSKLTSLDVSGFDTSQCTSIENTFTNCSLLTEIIGLDNWDVSNVTTMSQVFATCTVLANLDGIANWDVSKVRYMYNVFAGCSSLTSLNINDWDVSSVTTLQTCFSGLVMESLDLSKWNVSQVSNFGFLFSSAKIKNINVSGWDTSAGTIFQYLFTSCTEFEEIDLSSWKVSSDANLYLAFNGCSTSQTIYYDPTLWQGDRQTSVTWIVAPSKNNGYWLDMSAITGDTTITLYNENNLATEEILTDWGDGTQDSELTHTYSTAGEYVVVSNLQNRAMINGVFNSTIYSYLTKANIFYKIAPSHMFYNCTKLKEVTFTDNWADSLGTTSFSFWRLFGNCSALTTINNIDILCRIALSDMTSVFEGCKSLAELDLSKLNTQNVQKMSSVFNGCSSLTSLDLSSSWNTSQCTTMFSMFNGCSSLTSLDVSSWNFEKCTTINQFIRGTTNLVDFNMSGVTFGATSVNFQNFAYQSGVQNVNMSNITTAGKVAFESPFYGCSKLETIDFSNSHFKPSTTQNMFNGCSSLTSLDLSMLDTSSCTDMSSMFNGCGAITSINMSGWNTANVIDMGDMFRNTTSLQVLDVSNWDVSSVNSTTGSITYMFANTRIKHLDLSSWKITDDIEYCNYVFLDNPNLEQIDLSNWLVTQLQGYQFRGSSKLKTIGMLYSSAEAINALVASGFNNYRNGITIYYQDADPTQLTPVEGVTFKKYQTPTTIQLPPHIQLHSLPDGTRDEVDIKTGILTRRVGYVVLDGSEDELWNDSLGNAYPNEANTKAMCLPKSFIELPSIDSNKTNILVTYFKPLSIGYTNGQGYEVMAVSTDDKYHIQFVKQGISTLIEWREYLSQNPVTIYYKQQTPTTEQLILNYNNSCDYGRILPTGMCDKYDVVNSMYTQTMTSILLDGENTWDAMEEMTNVVKFTATGTTVGVEELNMLGAGGLYCDNDLFPNINDDSDVEHCRVDEAGNKFYIYINKDRLMSPDLIGYQIWLQENPFNLIYELAEHLTYSKLYEELDATQARWEGMDCMRDGAIKYHANNSDNITMYPTLEYVAPSINNFEVTMLEPNTDYTIYAEGINVNDTINLGGTDINFNNGTVYTSGDNQWLRIDNNDSFYNMVITKGDTTGEVVPYFDGMTSVENPKVITPTKNLALIKKDEYIVPYSEVNVNVKNDGKIYLMGNAGSSYTTWDLTTGERIYDNAFHDLRTLQLEPGTYTITSTLDASQATGLSQGYTISLIVCADGKYVHNHVAYYMNNNFETKESKTTVTVENYFSCIVMQRWYTGSCDGIVASIQIEKGNTATNFAPAGGSTVSYTDLKLRSLPNGVKDTINVVTGEYVQRVGEIVFDGSEDEGWGRNWVYGDDYVYQCQPFTEKIPSMDDILTVADVSGMSCDKFIFVNGNSIGTIERSIFINSNYLRVRGTGLNNVEKFKQWLQENPITVQYELAEPITTKLDPQTLLAYEDGTINLSSNTGLLPTTHYTVPSTNTFHLPSMKTGTRYTLKYPSASGSITIGDINYSISSNSMLFTTPLKINGDTSAIIFSDSNPENVVLLEGAYNTREVPYFTGVKSVKNPNITIIDQLSTESTTYNCETEIELRGLPNGVADKLDIIKGKLTTNVGIRPYQEGDENLSNIWTDGYETVYALSSPVVTNVTIDHPTVTTNSLIELSSDYLIPQLNYRAPSSNNFPLDLLQSNTTYTLYADTLTSGSYILGGTRTGIYSQPHTITLGDMTDNLLTFNGDLGLSNVMLVKGNSLKTTLPPYFLGIRSVTDGHLLVEGMAGETNEITFDEGIVLRDCNGVKDSIDLITCTLTKRTGEITLTGAEGWYRADNESTTDHNVFKLTLGGLKEALVMCDTLQSVFDTKMIDCIHAHTNELCIVIANATIGGNTVNALKSWLNQHPTTVVYQLSTPIEVQLENTWTTTPPTSYDNQTEISSTVSTNSLKPMISVTIATTTLEEIVSDLEAQNAQLEEENMATMLALTSVYETLAAPAAVSTMSLDDEVSTVNLSDGKDGNNVNGMSVSPIGMVYVNLIRKGLKTIDQVPYNLQAEVMYALRGME